MANKISQAIQRALDYMASEMPTTEMTRGSVSFTAPDVEKIIGQSAWGQGMGMIEDAIRRRLGGAAPAYDVVRAIGMSPYTIGKEAFMAGANVPMTLMNTQSTAGRKAAELGLGTVLPLATAAVTSKLAGKVRLPREAIAGIGGVSPRITGAAVRGALSGMGFSTGATSGRGIMEQKPISQIARDVVTGLPQAAAGGAIIGGALQGITEAPTVAKAGTKAVQAAMRKYGPKPSAAVIPVGAEMMVKNAKAAENFFRGDVGKKAFTSKNMWSEQMPDGTKVLYSYGRHYPMAVVKPDGTAYLNSQGYSNTTARHLSNTRAAALEAGYKLREIPSTNAMQDILAGVDEETALTKAGVSKTSGGLYTTRKLQTPTGYGRETPKEAGLVDLGKATDGQGRLFQDSKTGKIEVYYPRKNFAGYALQHRGTDWEFAREALPDDLPAGITQVPAGEMGQGAPWSTTVTNFNKANAAGNLTNWDDDLLQKIVAKGQGGVDRGISVSPQAQMAAIEGAKAELSRRGVAPIVGTPVGAQPTTLTTEQARELIRAKGGTIGYRPDGSKVYVPEYLTNSNQEIPISDVPKGAEMRVKATARPAGQPYGNYREFSNEMDRNFVPFSKADVLKGEGINLAGETNEQLIQRLQTAMSSTDADDRVAQQAFMVGDDQTATDVLFRKKFNEQVANYVGQELKRRGVAIPPTGAEMRVKATDKSGMPTLKTIQQFEETGFTNVDDEAIAMQQMIEGGQGWKLQGSYGRSMMDAIESGRAMLGAKPTSDYYGNRIPSRTEVQAGTKGSPEYVANNMGVDYLRNVLGYKGKLKTEALTTPPVGAEMRSGAVTGGETYVAKNPIDALRKMGYDQNSIDMYVKQGRESDVFNAFLKNAGFKRLYFTDTQSYLNLGGPPVGAETRVNTDVGMPPAGKAKGTLPSGKPITQADITVRPSGVTQRLEYLRQQINNENISYGEIAELQSLSKYIDPSDVQLRQWAGIPEQATRTATGTWKVPKGAEMSMTPREGSTSVLRGSQIQDLDAGLKQLTPRQKLDAIKALGEESLAGFSGVRVDEVDDVIAMLQPYEKFEVLRTALSKQVAPPVGAEMRVGPQDLPRLRNQFVNLYRMVNGSNEGLTSEGIARMTPDQLNREISRLSNTYYAGEVPTVPPTGAEAKVSAVDRYLKNKPTGNFAQGTPTWQVNVDGQPTIFTPQDVADYFSTAHGQSGMRSFGPVQGDWRMIDNIANDAKAFFDNQGINYPEPMAGGALISKIRARQGTPTGAEQMVRPATPAQRPQQMPLPKSGVPAQGMGPLDQQTLSNSVDDILQILDDEYAGQTMTPNDVAGIVADNKLPAEVTNEVVKRITGKMLRAGEEFEVPLMQIGTTSKGVPYHYMPANEYEYASTIMKVGPDGKETIKFGDTNGKLTVVDDITDWFDDIIAGTRKWKSTDAWRGYHETPINPKYTKLSSGWITGMPDETTTRKADLGAIFEKIQSGEVVPPRPLYWLFEPTSNVFSTASDILVKKADVGAITNWLKTAFNLSKQDLQAMFD